MHNKDQVLSILKEDTKIYIDKYIKNNNHEEGEKQIINNSNYYQLLALQKYLEALEDRDILLKDLDRSIILEILLRYYFKNIPAEKVARGIFLVIMTAIFVAILSPYKIMSLILLAMTGLFVFTAIISIGFERKLIIFIVVVASFLMGTVGLGEKILAGSNSIFLFLGFVMGFFKGIMASFAGIFFFIFAIFLFYFLKTSSLKDAIHFFEVEKHKYYEEELLNIVKHRKDRLREVLSSLESREINDLLTKK